MHYRRLEDLGTTDDARADMVAVIPVLRELAQGNPALARLMFSRSFTEFDPGPSERRAGRCDRDDVPVGILGPGIPAPLALMGRFPDGNAELRRLRCTASTSSTVIPISAPLVCWPGLACARWSIM